MLHRLLLNLTVAAAAATLVALASPWAAGASADVAQVTVVSPGGAQQTLSLEALAGSEDVHEHTYVVRADGGEGTQTVTGFSLARILDAAGADPYGFSYLEVQRPAGGAVLLSREQALASDGEAPPAVYASDAGTGFLRPSTGPEDLNASDSFSAPQGIAIVLRKGTHLKVRATASARRTRPGQPVEFEAIVEQAGSGERLQYSWYFDDGASASGAAASHSFAKRGSYDVVVGVTSDGNETGASAVVTIQVGAPLGGPDRKGGGTNEDAGAPDHGAATGPESGSTGNAAVAPVGHTLPDTRPAAALSARQGTADGGKQESKPPTAAGELVEGELVSAETSVPPKQAQAAARTGSLDGGSGSGGIPGAAWGILGAIGLLGIGALVETRSLLS